MSAECWKLTLACSQVEGEALGAGTPLDDDPAPVFVATEPDDEGDRWRLDVYFEGKPSRDLLRRVAALVPSARVRDPRAKPLPPDDWVTMSQAGFAPLVAGRFHVRTPATAARDDLVDIVVPAGLAFGTGQHATTAGCLVALDALRSAGARYRRIVDLGTGTGLLVIASRRLWPAATLVATDIDPVAIDVARENIALNHARRIRLAVADGIAHPAVVDAAPYDLVIANILAQPLIAMAGHIAAITAPGGTILLAGLLEAQRRAVLHAYRQVGLRPADRGGGPWPVLRLTSPRVTR